MNSENIMKEYFPFTNKCSIDKKDCFQNNSCKFWIDHCWLAGFEELLKTFFENILLDSVVFKDENGKLLEGLRYVDFRLMSNDKTDNKPIELEVRICLNSYRLAKKVKEKLELTQWSLESTCYDGGDDADLIMRCPCHFKDKPELKKLFVFIKYKFVPEFVKIEKQVNTCAICKIKCLDLKEHKEVAICSICENKIILENISNYL